LINLTPEIIERRKEVKETVQTDDREQRRTKKDLRALKFNHTLYTTRSVVNFQQSGQPKRRGTNIYVWSNRGVSKERKTVSQGKRERNEREGMDKERDREVALCKPHR